MADITMCDGINCPLRETCYRFKAKPDKYGQSYFVKVPVDNDGKCEFYWKN